MNLNDLRRTSPMEWVEMVSRAHGLNLTDAGSIDRIIEAIASEIQQAVSNPIRLYGWRTETMFAFVTSSLRKVRILKGEDSGLLLSSLNVTPPDYRVLLESGTQFFVEVKNWNPRGAIKKPFRARVEDIEKLTSYSKAFEVELRFAIYWRRLNLWTLTRREDFVQVGEKLELSVNEAIKRSSMSELGDIMVGTEPPLSLSLDASVPVIVDADGMGEFTVGSTSLYSAGVLIESELERQLAFYFMLHGTWSQFRQVPIMQDSKLLGIDNHIEPAEWTPEQGFAFLGSLSSMISSLYRFRTSRSQQVRLLAPDGDPSSFGVCIPDDYEGEVLKLWRFVVHPNTDSEKSMA